MMVIPEVLHIFSRKHIPKVGLWLRTTATWDAAGILNSVYLLLLVFVTFIFCTLNKQDYETITATKQASKLGKLSGHVHLASLLTISRFSFHSGIWRNVNSFLRCNPPVHWFDQNLYRSLDWDVILPENLHRYFIVSPKVFKSFVGVSSLFPADAEVHVNPHHEGMVQAERCHAQLLCLRVQLKQDTGTFSAVKQKRLKKYA